MLRNYYRLNFFMQDSSPKSWVSNIRVRWCKEDGTPRLYKTIPNVWKDTRGEWHGKLVESEDGDIQRFFPLFIIDKERAGYKLIIHNRREGKAFMPCRYYPSFEEACFTAREAWIRMESDLTDEDLKFIDHTHMMEWKAISTAERMKKKNLPNFEIRANYHGKSLVEWDNYEVAF